MPSLDAFLGMKYGDMNAMSAWLMAHQIRHTTYAKAASLRGISITNFSITSYPDDDWFANHMTAHLLVQPFAVYDPSVSLNALQDATWDDESSFADWHQMHNLIHQRLDQGLGIFSVQ